MEEYDHMLWMKIRRRHESNFFNAFFFDEEDIAEDDIDNIISDIACYLDLPIPVVNNKCNSMAEILLSDNARECELFYNIELLKKAGINNKDAFKLCLVHEMAHQIFFKNRFGVFCNERWIQELAADMTAGLFSSKSFTASGKYKFAVSTQAGCITHPSGKIREKVVEYGRLLINEFEENDINIIKEVQKNIPIFVLMHYGELNQDWNNVVHDLQFPKPKRPEREFKIEDLSDDNLIKQYFLKHNKTKQIPHEDNR